MDSEEFRAILSRSRVGIWALIETAIRVANSDFAEELRRRRDKIVEALYTPPSQLCRSCNSNIVEEHQYFNDNLDTNTISNKSNDDNSTRILNEDFSKSPLTPESNNPNFSRGDEQDLDPYGGLFDDEQTKILTIKEQLEDPDQSEDAVVDLLQILADMDITFQALKETDIGRHVNRLRKHPSGEVRRLVKMVVRKWKETVDEWVKVNQPQTSTNLLADGDSPQHNIPLQVMHKAEKKYEIGKITGEEEAKQRQLKSILNKLTTQNFEKLFEQVKDVNIDNFVTLSGVISQIFDKALMEPTFCEMYANFCFHLAAGLPNLRVDNETITFKTLLLNKCQEEFERGEREEEEANKAEEVGENKHTAEEREEKRLQASRRMLGNIRLIGGLYKKKMLTARVMHECINKLLGQYQTPDEENIEALCKLMSTIGEMIDHPKAKEHMDAYFDIMASLSNNMELSSRVRFMLKDVIDLRKNRWQQRRKVEGPKKIDEVHRDAAQERQAKASRLGRAPSIGSSVRRGPPVDFAPRTPSMLPSPNSQMSGFRAVPP